MSRQTAIRVPDDIYQRLQALAEKTGRTASFYIREAVEEHLEDLEDRYAAEAALIAHRRSGEPALSLDDLDAALGLED